MRGIFLRLSSGAMCVCGVGVVAADCQPCRCPGSIVLGDVNAFSSVCDDGQCYNCSLGHIGPLCDVCDDGFYGTPNNASVRAASISCRPSSVM